MITWKVRVSATGKRPIDLEVGGGESVKSLKDALFPALEGSTTSSPPLLSSTQIVLFFQGRTPGDDDLLDTVFEGHESTGKRVLLQMVVRAAEEKKRRRRRKKGAPEAAVVGVSESTPSPPSEAPLPSSEGSSALLSGELTPEVGLGVDQTPGMGPRAPHPTPAMGSMATEAPSATPLLAAAGALLSASAASSSPHNSINNDALPVASFVHNSVAGAVPQTPMSTPAIGAVDVTPAGYPVTPMLHAAARSVGSRTTGSGVVESSAGMLAPGPSPRVTATPNPTPAMGAVFGPGGNKKGLSSVTPMLRAVLAEAEKVSVGGAAVPLVDTAASPSSLPRTPDCTPAMTSVAPRKVMVTPMLRAVRAETVKVSGAAALASSDSTTLLSGALAAANKIHLSQQQQGSIGGSLGLGLNSAGTPAFPTQTPHPTPVVGGRNRGGPISPILKRSPGKKKRSTRSRASSASHGSHPKTPNPTPAVGAVAGHGVSPLLRGVAVATQGGGGPFMGMRGFDLSASGISAPQSTPAMGVRGPQGVTPALHSVAASVAAVAQRGNGSPQNRPTTAGYKTPPVELASFSSGGAGNGRGSPRSPTAHRAPVSSWGVFGEATGSGVSPPNGAGVVPPAPHPTPALASTSLTPMLRAVAQSAAAHMASEGCSPLSSPVKRKRKSRSRSNTLTAPQPATPAPSPALGSLTVPTAGVHRNPSGGNVLVGGTTPMLHTVAKRTAALSVSHLNHCGKTPKPSPMLGAIARRPSAAGSSVPAAVSQFMRGGTQTDAVRRKLEEVAAFQPSVKAADVSAAPVAAVETPAAPEVEETAPSQVSVVNSPAVAAPVAPEGGDVSSDGGEVVEGLPSISALSSLPRPTSGTFTSSGHQRRGSGFLRNRGSGSAEAGDGGESPLLSHSASISRSHLRPMSALTSPTSAPLLEDETPESAPTIPAAAQASAEDSMVEEIAGLLVELRALREAGGDDSEAAAHLDVKMREYSRVLRGGEKGKGKVERVKDPVGIVRTAPVGAGAAFTAAGGAEAPPHLAAAAPVQRRVGPNAELPVEARGHPLYNSNLMLKYVSRIAMIYGALSTFAGIPHTKAAVLAMAGSLLLTPLARAMFLSRGWASGLMHAGFMLMLSKYFAVGAVGWWAGVIGVVWDVRIPGFLKDWFATRRNGRPAPQAPVAAGPAEAEAVVVERELRPNMHWAREVEDVVRLVLHSFSPWWTLDKYEFVPAILEPPMVLDHDAPVHPAEAAAAVEAEAAQE